MTNSTTPTPSIVCFGEILWDIFPTGAKAGGAPFNVAYNLKKMGIDARMISRAGNDDLGKELLHKIAEWGIPTTDCQIDNTYATGTVEAAIDENNEAHYTIIGPVAWDFITMQDRYEPLLKNAEAFVFGSLITRNETSRNTLLKLLEVSLFNVFDINIRPPVFSPSIVKELLQKAHLVKMNKAELRQVTMLIGKEYVSEDDNVRALQEQFSINEVLLTKGSKGALYYNQTKKYNCPAIPVDVKDTVGSGDSFLAGFLSYKAMNKSIEETLLNAAMLGAFITSKEGACPPYTLSEFEAFKNSKMQTPLIIE